MRNDEFKVNDWVVVLPEDRNYSNSRKDKAVIIRSMENDWYSLRNYASTWRNAYKKIRKATPQEIAIATGKPISITQIKII